MRAVITDWGGVLTQPIRDTVRAWIIADQIDWNSYVAVIGPWLTDAHDEHDGHREQDGPAAPREHDGHREQDGPAAAAPREHDGHREQAAHSGHAGSLAHDALRARVALSGVPNPVHALERGECTVADFERLLAERLVTTTGGRVNADGLLTRMLAASRPDPLMYRVIRDLRAGGVRTALLSNSWGDGSYPRHDFASLFDTVVISGEIGMRKPEPRIFLHTAELLNIAPEECVFIDDMERNVRAAVGCGMTGLHHTDPAGTVMRLTELFAAR